MVPSLPPDDGVYGSRPRMTMNDVAIDVAVAPLLRPAGEPKRTIWSPLHVAAPSFCSFHAGFFLIQIGLYSCAPNGGKPLVELIVYRAPNHAPNAFCAPSGHTHAAGHAQVSGRRAKGGRQGADRIRLPLRAFRRAGGWRESRARRNLRPRMRSTAFPR